MIRPDDLMDRQTALADSGGKTLPADSRNPTDRARPASSLLTAIPISTHSSRSIAGMKEMADSIRVISFMPRAPDRFLRMRCCAT